MSTPMNTLDRHLRFQRHTQQVTTMTSYTFFLPDKESKKRGSSKVLALSICTAVLDLQKAFGISESNKQVR